MSKTIASPAAPYVRQTLTQQIHGERTASILSGRPKGMTAQAIHTAIGQMEAAGEIVRLPSAIREGTFSEGGNKRWFIASRPKCDGSGLKGSCGGCFSIGTVLAQQIIDGIESLTATLKEREDDIRQLWKEFDKLPKGESILGCRTKKQFCEKHLHRTPRAIRYMLDGGNPNNNKRGEIISPAPPDAPQADEPETSVTDEKKSPRTKLLSSEAVEHDVIAERICRVLIDKSIPGQNVVWAPWTAKTDADIRDFGREPVTDRYRVTLYLSRNEAEGLLLSDSPKVLG